MKRIILLSIFIIPQIIKSQNNSIKEIDKYYVYRNNSYVKKNQKDYSGALKEDSLAYDILKVSFENINFLYKKDSLDMSILNEYIKVAQQFIIDYPSCDDVQWESHQKKMISNGD